jgi:aspartate aminotransferase-like enzyme
VDKILNSEQEMEKQSPKLTSGLREFSVVYTDRALNLMSPPFQQVMKDISSRLKSVYKGEHVAIIPGSGSYAMEAVARQFALGIIGDVLCFCTLRKFSI